MKLSVESLKTGKLAPKNLKPLIKEVETRFNEKADQVLLGLSHSKQAIPARLKQALDRIENNPADIVGRVGRSVLERAETVRKQLIEKAEVADVRWVPEWLKDVSFVRKAAASALDEKSAKPKSAKASKTSAKPKAAKKSPAKKA